MTDLNELRHPTRNKLRFKIISAYKLAQTCAKMIENKEL